MTDSEADTYGKHVTSRFYEAGWTDDQISAQRTMRTGGARLRVNPAQVGQQRCHDDVLLDPG